MLSFLAKTGGSKEALKEGADQLAKAGAKKVVEKPSLSVEEIVIYTLLAIALIALAVIVFLLIKGDSGKYNIDTSNKFKRADKIYAKITSIPLAGKDLINIKNSLYYKSYASENVLRYKAVNTYILLWLLTGLFYAVYYFSFCSDKYLAYVGVIFAVFAKNIIQDTLIGDDTKTLEGLLDVLFDLRDQYHFVKDVDDALIETTNNAPANMIPQISRLHEAIEYQDTLDMYNEECPNSQLKCLANICFRTKEFGDNEENGRSVFLEGLQNIAIAIKEELNLRRKIRLKCSGLTAICIVPILLTNPTKNWAMSNFDDANFFYLSNLDLLFRFTFLLLTLLVYRGLKLLTSFTAKTRTVKISETRWENNALKFKPLENFVRWLEPKRATKRFYKITDLLDNSGSDLTIDWLYLRKFIFFIVGFLIIMCFTFRLNTLTRQSIYDGTSSKFIKEDVAKISAKKDTILVKDLDKELLESNKKGQEGKTSLEVKTDTIIKILEGKGIDNERDQQEIIDRLQRKLDLVDSTNVTVLDLIYWILFSMCCYYIPTLSTRIQKSLRTAHMVREVEQFHIIILLLMYDPLVDVDTILEWMESFSVVFKDAIIVCRNSMLRGSQDALLDLKFNVNYKDFGKLVDSLMRAEDLQIREVFDNLRTESTFLAQDREFRNEKLIEDRSSLAKFIGFLPGYYLLIGYLVVPMIWGSLMGMGDIMMQMNS